MGDQPRLRLLGCGHSEAIDLFNTNALLETPKGRLLIDAGYTIKPALRAQGLTLEDVEGAFITHVHADHCIGVERLAIEGRYVLGKRFQLLFEPAIETELWDHCMKGLIGSSSDGSNTLEDFFEVTRVVERRFHFGGVEVELYPTRHTPGKPCFGLLLNNRIAYTSDTLAIPEQLAAMNPEVIFHDVTLVGENPVHPSIDSLIDAYPRWLRERMWLQSYEDFIDAEHRRRIEANFAGVAWQGQSVAL
jgi:glyoxylase-like metal-dependent hydrolase (beta-lactamase superfamily II)